MAVITGLFTLLPAPCSHLLLAESFRTESVLDVQKFVREKRLAAAETLPARST